MKKIKLGEILKVKRGASLSGEYYSDKGEKIRLTLGNFDYPGKGFKVNSSKNDLFFIGQVKPEFILKKGDIITPLTEQVAGLLGETAEIPCDNTYIQSGDIGLVKIEEGLADKNYIYYLLSSQSIKKQLGAAAQQTKIRHTSPDKIEGCIAWIPDDINMQMKIGRILKSIDNQIIRNKDMVQKLQVLAQSTYSRWFNQFEFPHESGKSYKSDGGKMIYNEELKKEIPEGWNVDKLNNIISWESSSQPPKENFIYEYKDGYIRFLQNRDYDSSEYKTYIPFSKNTKTCTKFDIMIDKYGDAGKTRYGLEGAYNVALAKINPKINNTQEYIRGYLEQDGIYRYLNNACTASTRASLNEQTLDGLKIIIPCKELLEKYEIFQKSIINEILKIRDFNNLLIKQKNIIQPLLINGQLS